VAEIVIKNLRKDFGDFTAVKESSFSIADGEFFMLLGPSGCGKTTTLRMIAGLELPSAGEIYLDGVEISQLPTSQRDIAFVFQMFALYPHMNVRRNISYPLVSQGMKRRDVKARVSEVAQILGIEGMLDKPVGGLSGGDRQRVALGVRWMLNFASICLKNCVRCMIAWGPPQFMSLTISSKPCKWVTKLL